ncbi:exopolygalacturonase clone GBGA483-like [Rhodamnia argentea]|uniref:Exopolygalacturonase clone GBGA483-like n=1 Tax=Rhodamnia argentea TaxID=178133 RepID=A0ABM3HBF4_9MYRT|nr:exopolygalacturonase clone GBGA483-like [Rhodamnia argentea]
MELPLRIVPILGICLVIATRFTAPADAYEPAPSPPTDDPFTSAPVQTGGDPPKSPLPSPLADGPFPTAPAQMGGDPPMTPASPVPSPLEDEPIGTAPAPMGGDPSLTPVSLVGVFNVVDYGAVADGKTDSSMAFLSAWEDACAHPGNSTVYVPDNTFLVGPVSFTGPCRNPYSPKVEVRGILKAPKSPSQFPSNNWIVFRDLRGLVLTGETGRALFDGRGSEAWSDPSCQKKSRCNKLITVGSTSIRIRRFGN